MNSLSTLLYTHSRNLQLCEILLVSDSKQKMTLLGRWLACHGYRGPIPKWFLEECEEAVSKAWSD